MSKENIQTSSCQTDVSGALPSFAEWIRFNNIPKIGTCKRNVKTYYMYKESVFNTDELFDEYLHSNNR